MLHTINKVVDLLNACNTDDPVTTTVCIAQATRLMEALQRALVREYINLCTQCGKESRPDDATEDGCLFCTKN